LIKPNLNVGRQQITARGSDWISAADSAEVQALVIHTTDRRAIKRVQRKRAKDPDRGERYIVEMNGIRLKQTAGAITGADLYFWYLYTWRKPRPRGLISRVLLGRWTHMVVGIVPEYL
jgi:hypothetical protein